MPSSLSSEPPGDGNVLLINSLNSSTCDWFILSLGSDPAGQGLTLVRCTAFQIPSRGKLVDFMLQHKQREYLENLCWLFPSVAKTWHLLLIGATVSQLSQNSLSRDVCMLGFIHGWQHDLKEEGRKWCWGSRGFCCSRRPGMNHPSHRDVVFCQRLQLVPTSSFSLMCSLLSSAAVASLLLMQETVCPGNSPSKCMHAHFKGRLTLWSRSSLSGGTTARGYTWEAEGPSSGRTNGASSQGLGVPALLDREVSRCDG